MSGQAPKSVAHRKRTRNLDLVSQIPAGEACSALQGLKSLCENLCAKRICSVGLQADTVDSSTCPPEGGRYIDQNQVLTQTLKPGISSRYGVAAEQVAEKCHFGASGVKTPEGNSDFMSCLKARPTNHGTFSATCEAATSTFEAATSKVYL